MENLTIRFMQREDIPQVMEIVKCNYDHASMLQALPEFEAAFTNTMFVPQYLVAEREGIIVGSTGFMPSSIDYEVYEIFWVNVKPEYQRQGIGTELVRHVIELVKQKKASLVLLTASNQAFYVDVLGFCVLAEFRGKNKWLMGLELI